MTKYIVTVDGYGNKCWYNEANQLHRLDGPAVDDVHGIKCWYQNGQCHRLDGPAVEYANGDKYWYIEDEELTEAEFLKRTKVSTCENKVVEVDGMKYKLVAL